jgi:hypothetical protein
VATSNQFSYFTPQNRDVIEEAFARIGVLPNELEGEPIYEAIRSANFLLTTWANRGLNLFTVRTEIIPLVIGQVTYPLAPNTIEVLEVMLRTSIRNLNGIAASSNGGIANNAFDGDPLTACTQVAPNGNISYQWANPFSISLVGVTSFTDEVYDLVCEASPDGISWYPVLTIPTQSYLAGQNYWFDVPTIIPGIAFRVRETGGATLNINELYFNNLVNDRTMSPFSRAEYTQQPLKEQVGPPSSFYVNRQINPTISIWPAPIPVNNESLLLNRTSTIEDLGSLLNSPAIANRFMEALIFGIAHRISLKYTKQVVPGTSEKMLQGYTEELQAAMRSDKERVPMRIYGDYMSGWGRAR